MRIEYLADALDHFKAAVVQKLVKSDALRDLVVDPMATDAPRWTEEHYELYSRILGISTDQLVRIDAEHGSLDAKGRRELGREGHQGDVFLDPDTGVRPPSGSPHRKYVRGRDIRTLIEEAPQRVVAVYQHARRSPSDRWALEVVDRVRGDDDIKAAGYVSRQVALLFFSRDADRLTKIRTVLRDWTRPVSERVASWE